MPQLTTTLAIVGATLLYVGCSRNQPPNQPLAPYVDLDRFMGTWYVHGYTPTPIDKNAWNGTETYQRLDNGKIQTTYEFRKGSAEGKLKTYNPVGTVVNSETNSEWRMRFFGIINAAYYVLYVDPDYRYTVIGHPNKRYAWIMSRDSNIDEARYDSLRNELVNRDYDLTNFERMRHQ